MHEITRDISMAALVTVLLHQWLLKLTVLGQRKAFDISASPLKRQGFLCTLPA